jgi:hypothetical protein
VEKKFQNFTNFPIPFIFIPTAANSTRDRKTKNMQAGNKGGIFIEGIIHLFLRHYIQTKSQLPWHMPPGEDQTEGHSPEKLE